MKKKPKRATAGKLAALREKRAWWISLLEQLDKVHHQAAATIFGFKLTKTVKKTIIGVGRSVVGLIKTLESLEQPARKGKRHAR